MSVMKYYKRITAIVLFIAVTICSILPTGLEARAADVTESNPMFRLYNPNSGEHFYTADEGEKDYLSGIGWNYEGIGWNAPVSSNSPVYRLYNPYSSDHHYTMDEGERDYLSQTGWNYEGIGWYSDDAKSVPLYRQFNPNEVIGTHNYTKSLEENDWLCSTGWQAEGIGWYGVYSSEDEEGNEPLVESEKSVDNYAVINIEVDQFTKSVNAKVGAPGNCRLLVRFVPEDVYFADGYYSGKEYINDGATQASCDVVASDEFVEVGSVIDNADALPDNFVAEAVLVDANGNNLCSPYTSIENTRKHEEFEAKDIYSFEGHNVVNFDGDATTNFGVLEDDVKILTAEEIVEEVNEDESKNYTITSPSENIEVGDKVYIKDGAGEYLFKVAEKNTLSDGKIFVKAARANDANHGFKIEDFFTYVDVKMEGYGEQGDEYSENEKLDSSYSDEEDVIISNEKGASVGSGYRFGPKIDTKYFEMEASISGDVTIDVDFEFDKLISREPFTCDVEYTSTQKNTISAKGKLSGSIGKKTELKKTLGKVPIPIVPLLVNAKMEVGFELSGQLSAGFTAEGTSSVEAGFHYNSVTGYVPFSQKSNTWEIKATGEVELKAGPTASVGIEILYGAVGVELEGFIGLVLEATIEARTGNDDHACTVCASGELKACTELSLNVECLYGYVKPFDATLIGAEIKLFDFYVSLASPKDSMFHGKVKCGRGKCPNKYVDDAEKIDIEVNYVTVESSVINQSTGNPVFVGRYPVFTVKTKGYEKLQNRLNMLSNENKAKVESYMLSEEQKYADIDTSNLPSGYNYYPSDHSYNYYIEIYRSDNNILSFTDGGIYNTLYNGSTLWGDELECTYYNINSKTGEDITSDAFITDIDKASDAIVKEFFLKYPNLISESYLKKLIMREYNDGSLKYIMYNDFVEFVFEGITLENFSVDVSYDEL